MSNESNQKSDQITNKNSLNQNYGGNQLIGNVVGRDIVFGLSTEAVAEVVVELKNKEQPTVWNGRNPYRGLEAYEESDAKYFYGRETLVATVVERLQTASFVTIAGPSGSGKSSLAKAGVIHALRQGAIEGSERWLLATLQPKGEPIGQLASAIEKLTQRPNSGDYLRENGDNPEALLKQVHSLLSDNEKQQFVLLVDQFEEVFTQTKSAETRRNFINLLTTAAQAEAGRCKIILSLRSDFVSHCASYDTLRELMSDQFQLVGTMSPPDLAKAITLPALEVGAGIDPALVSRVISDMKGSPDALPLMSFALRDLFEAEKSQIDQPMNMTLAKYVERGGLENALEQHANKVFAKFTDDQKKIAETIFSKLIEVGQGRADTRRTATLAQLIPAGGSKTAVIDVIQRLSAVNVRLLTRSGIEATHEIDFAGQNTSAVTIAHEKLIDAWPWLRQLVDSNRELISLQNQVETDANEWVEQKDDSYLYRGGRLLQIEERDEELRPLLSTNAHQFIQSSTAERQRLEAETEAIRKQEEELKSQKRVGTILRWATAVVGVLLVVAVVSAVQAFQGQAEAQNAEATATIAQGQAEIDAQNAQNAQAIATVAQGQAEIDAQNAQFAEATATFAQGEAFSEAENALNAEATATIAQGQAEMDAQNAQNARATADALRAEAERQERRLLAQSLAFRTLDERTDNNNAELRTLLGIEAVRIDQEIGQKELALNYRALQAAVSVPFFPRILTGHTDTITSVAFDPNGQWLATASQDNTIQLWDLENLSNAPVSLTGHEGIVLSVAFSPDGQTLASGSFDNTARLWDVNNLDSDPIILSIQDGAIYSVAFSPDGQTLATASDNRTIRLWQTDDPYGSPAPELRVDFGFLFVTFSPDGQTIASSDVEGKIQLWDANNPNEAPVVFPGGFTFSPYVSLAFSPDGQTLASANLDGTISLWSVNNPSVPLEIITGHEDSVVSLAFSPDGQTLASASMDSTVRLWNVNNLEADPQILSDHTDDVNFVAFSPDGKTLASASSDNTVRLWNVTNLNPNTPDLSGHEGTVFSVAFSPDSQTLAFGGEDGIVRIWDVNNTNAPPQMLPGHEGFVNAVAFSSDGQMLASAGQDSTVRIWNLANLSLAPHIFDAHVAAVNDLSFSSNGQFLASASEDNTVRLWDLLDLNASPTVVGSHVRSAVAVAFFPDGDRLASVSQGGFVQLWDLNQSTTTPFDTFINNLGFIAISPDGSNLVSGQQLWDLNNLDEEPLILSGHSDGINFVAFSPDGKTVATASNDSTIRLWDMADPTAAPIILSGHEDRVVAVAFSPDGKTLASAGADSTIRLWDSLEGLVLSGCERVARNLTWDEWQEYLGIDERYRQTCPNHPVHSSVPDEYRP
ncbi:MAG: AAA family ATPase [Chloroflexota bacterium]